MTLTLTPTTRITQLVTESGVVPARVWEGTTETGIPVIALVTRIAVKQDQDCTAFERELLEQRPPSIEAQQAFPTRLVL
jgi:hypothetical protein